jgi:hypothetical protein
MSESESKPKPNLDRSLDDLIKEGKPKQEKRKPGKKQGAHKGSGDGGNQGSGHRLVVVNNGGINKRGRGGARNTRGRGRGRARASAERKPKVATVDLDAKKNEDGSVTVMCGEIEAVTISSVGEVKINTGGKFTEEMLKTLNDTLSHPLGVRVLTPDGLEGEWLVTDNHIWLVRIVADQTTLPVIGYPPAGRGQFPEFVLKHAGKWQA